MSLLAQHDRHRPREAGQIGVMVVDDQEYFRGVMREVVEATDGFHVVGEAASGEAALEAVAELSPRLVIMDKRMPGIGGIEACRVLTERHPRVVLVITSVEDNPSGVIQGCRAKFVPKQDLCPRRLRQIWDERGVPA